MKEIRKAMMEGKELEMNENIDERDIEDGLN